ncbi:MAG: hypothetical protein AAF415_17135 [Pseudomonadota bacterium]
MRETLGGLVARLAMPVAITLALGSAPSLAQKVELPPDLDQREELRRSAKFHVTVAHIGAYAVPIGHLAEAPGRVSVWDDEPGDVRAAELSQPWDYEMVQNRDMELFLFQFCNKGAAMPETDHRDACGRRGRTIASISSFEVLPVPYSFELIRSYAEQPGMKAGGIQHGLQVFRGARSDGSERISYELFDEARRIQVSNCGTSARYRAPSVFCDMKVFYADRSWFLGLNPAKADLWQWPRLLERAERLLAIWKLDE